MTPTLVKYSQEFRTIDGNRWYGIEIPIAPDQDPIEAFKKAETLVQQAFHGSTPNSNEAEQPKEVQVERTIGLTVEEVLSSPDIKILESYKYLVRGKPEFEKAYFERLEELSA